MMSQPGTAAHLAERVRAVIALIFHVSFTLHELDGASANGMNDAAYSAAMMGCLGYAALAHEVA